MPKAKIQRLLSNNKLSDCLAAMVLLLACLPIVRAIYVLFSTGANCASNDCVRWIGTVDSLLNGTFNWLELPSACFVYPHFLLIPYLLQLAQIFAGTWDIRTETLIGLILLAVSSLLQWDMLREKLSKRLQLALLAGIAAVNFSTTQYSTLLSGVFSVMISGSCLLGFTVSLWSLSRFRSGAKRFAGDARSGDAEGSIAPLALMGIGLVVSAYSWGTVLPASLCTLIALLALGYRSRRAVAAWCIASAIAVLPYAYFGFDVLKHASLPAGSGTLSLTRILDVIGRSLSNDIAVQLDSLPQSIQAGAAGCIASVCMVSYLVAQKVRMPGLVPVASLSLYSLISAVLIASSRAHIAPWYAVPTKFIWVAVVTLAIYCISQIDRREHLGNGQTKSASAFAVAFGLIVLSLFTWRYIWVNETYDDKHFYLKSRAPASESYQRHYLTAPTYGEPLIFQWLSGGANQVYAHSLGRTLERHGLLGFSKHQQWTLQGDYFLNCVRFWQKPSISLPIWTDSAWPIHPVPWHDFHHLDMAMQAPQVVTWKVSIPAGARAVLRTACCPGAIKQDSRFFGSDVAVTIRPLSAGSTEGPSVLKRTLFKDSTWLKMEERLDRFAGQTVEIKFISAPRSKYVATDRESAENESVSSSFKKQEYDWIVFQYPRIDLELKDGSYGLGSATNSNRATSAVSRPFNTDLSPDFPGYKDVGTILNAVQRENAFDGRFLVARNFSHLRLNAITHGGVGAAALIVTFKYANYPEFAAALPLLPDTGEHAYTYDFKLLQAPADAQLKSIEFRSQNENQSIQVRNVRLLQVF